MTAPAPCSLDPPYHPDTRGRDRDNGYRHDLDAHAHEQLLDQVAGLQGSVLISGYRHPLYDRELAGAGFERHEHAHNATASRCAHGRGPRLEAVWRRLEPGAAERLPLWTTVG